MPVAFDSKRVMLEPPYLLDEVKNQIRLVNIYEHADDTLKAAVPSSLSSGYLFWRVFVFFLKLAELLLIFKKEIYIQSKYPEFRLARRKPRPIIKTSLVFSALSVVLVLWERLEQSL